MSETPLADERHEATVTASETVYEGSVWAMRRDTVELGDGPAVRDYLDHPGAVAVLALDERGRMLVIRQYRHPARTRDWEIPAGLLDVAGEAPLAAARRELAEEADLAADRWSLLSEFLSSPGCNSEVVRIYAARGLHPLDPFERTEEEADMERRWVAVPEVVEAVLARRLGNPTLTIATLAAHARGLGLPPEGDAEEPWHVPGRAGAR